MTTLNGEDRHHHHHQQRQAFSTDPLPPLVTVQAFEGKKPGATFQGYARRVIYASGGSVREECCLSVVLYSSFTDHEQFDGDSNWGRFTTKNQLQ